MIQTATDNKLLNNFNKDYNYLSWFNNLSICFLKSKLDEIFEEKFGEDKAKNFIENILMANIISNRTFVIKKNDKRLLNIYSSKHLGIYGLVKKFIKAINNKTLWKYFNVKYIGDRFDVNSNGTKRPVNFIIDFNGENFIKHTGAIECMFIYQIAYTHYFFLVQVLNILRTSGFKLPAYDRARRFYDSLFLIVEDKINSAELTGMEVFTEYDLGFPYYCLFDELRKLTPISKRKFTYSAMEDNLSLKISIKEYSIIAETFAKYLNGVWTEKDIGRVIKTMQGNYKIKAKDVIHTHSSDLDYDNFSTVRLTQGSNENRMRVIVEITGQRLINRLFSPKADVNHNVKAHRIREYLYSPDDLVACLLWILLNCTQESLNNFKRLKNFNVAVYKTFVDEYIKNKQKEITAKGKGGSPRGVVVNTAVIIMLSKLNPHKQARFINSYFKDTDSKQKAEIRESIRLIDKLQSQIQKVAETSFTARLAKELKHVYKW